LNGGLTFFHRSYNSALLYYFYFPLAMTKQVIAIKKKRSGIPFLIVFKM